MGNGVIILYNNFLSRDRGKCRPGAGNRCFESGKEGNVNMAGTEQAVGLWFVGM